MISHEIVTYISFLLLGMLVTGGYVSVKAIQSELAEIKDRLSNLNR